MYKRRDRILEQVPEARFILSLRDVERWVASRLDMDAWTEWRRECPARGFGRPWEASAHRRRQRIAPFRERYRRCHGLADLDEVVAHWKADWRGHVARVRAEVPADRLLVFDIERDRPEALCRFAGLDDGAARHWGRENAALGRLGRAVARAAPRSVPSWAARRPRACGAAMQPRCSCPSCSPPCTSRGGPDSGARGRCGGADRVGFARAEVAGAPHPDERPERRQRQDR